MGTFAMTGGATGIGAAVRAQLAEAGHRVIVADLKDADVLADLSTAEGRRQAVAGLVERAADGLDGFVSCAGVGPATTPPSLITRINYFGTVTLVEGMKPLVAKRRGCMVLISSNSAPMGSDADYVEKCLAGDEAAAAARADEVGDGQSAYGGSKLAVTRWMRRHSTAYAKEGVRMNAVAPGITKTPLTDRVMADDKLGPAIRSFGASVPTGSIGAPEQIARVITFLLGPGADFMCGSVVFVDGGHDAMLRPDQF
jgi:NAD(P)-dependent dehydrogenase (short-subunit alcohol dehydrogenase family)